MTPDFSNRNSDLLVYREGPNRGCGIPLLLIGLGAALWILSSSNWKGGDGREGAIAGLIVCLLVIAFAIQILLQKNLIIDRRNHRLTRSTWLFFPLHTRIHEFSGLSSVKWTPRHESDSTVYDIVITSSKGDQILFSVNSMEAAKTRTGEIGIFLGLEQIHGDQGQLASAAAGEWPLRTIFHATGRSPWRLRTINATILVCSQRFETMLVLFSIPFGTIGLSFLLAPFLEISGTNDISSSVRLGLGTAFFLTGILFFWGRRGVSFDLQNRTVSFWCGLLTPFFTRRYDLVSFSKVALLLSVEEVSGRPTVIYELILSGETKRLVLFKSFLHDELSQLSIQISDFLRLPLCSNHNSQPT